MRSAVPVARRNILADRRRLAISTLGVGLAVALILLLQGLWSGVLAQVSAYQTNVGADLFVTEAGVRSPGESALPVAAAEQVRPISGVQAADAVTLRSVILEMDGVKEAVVVVGFRPGGLGGPWNLASGRTVRTGGELVIDEGLAGDHGIRVGQRIDVLGTPFRVVGLSARTRTFVGGGYVFVSEGDAEALFGSPATASAVLVRTQDPSAVATAIRAGTGLEVNTAGQAALDARAAYDKVLGGPLRLMIFIAFAAGTFTVALTAYSAVVDRLREYGIAKAMGAGRGRLFRIVLGQTLLLAALGTVAGYVLFLVGSRILVLAMPQFLVEVPTATLGAVVVAAGAMALLAAIVPTRRVSRLDPASVYRG